MPGKWAIQSQGNWEGGHMALLNDIFAWSGGLPAWQRDALRRLFLNRTLNPADLSELLAMVKEEHGKGGRSPVRPIALSLDDIPQADPRANVWLLRLDNLQNVNRFPAGHAIEFALDRLNVLFGENGAGKSGYARILKNACRARTRQPVLPDAFDGTLPRPVPSAEITFLVNGTDPKTVPWHQGAPGDRALGNVTVYDSACGADYITKEGASDYQPYGLPQLNRLAAAQRDMQTGIEQERQQIRLDVNAFSELHGEHELGQILTKLSKDTDIEQLRRLATLGVGDHSRIEELTKVLGTMNPEPDARSAERLAERLETAATNARRSQRYVTDRALDEVQHRLESRKVAEHAWVLAQKRLRQDDNENDTNLLPGTGNEVWKLLFEAAEKFSTECAYPGHAHPNLGDEARCVLCQSPLNIDAKVRMQRFAEYVADAASKNAEETAKRMMETMQAIAEASLEPVDATTLKELSTADAELHAFIEQTATNWKERRNWVQNCVEGDDWKSDRPALIDGDPMDIRLKRKAEGLRGQAKELRNSLDPQVKQRLEKERGALIARRSLDGRLKQIEQHISDATQLHNLTACHAELNPRKVSLKMTELAGTYVTGELARVMTEELARLGYRRKVEPDIKGRTDVGQTMVTLKIKGCQDTPGQVLSDGEQRAMGLALFLAEIRLQGHSSTVVFDDPSTSFDHHHRRNMAERLASLALDRPVLVFTHDAVFLTELSIAVANSHQSAKYQTIAWAAPGPGFVSTGLTWETMDAKARLVELEKSAGPLKDYAGDYMDEATKEQVKVAYTKLRGTIERAVREVFMNNTIRPFSDEVSVGSFGAVIGHPQGEWDQVSDMYDRCCEVTDAHDTNAAHQLPIPEPAVLVQDVNDFKALLEAAKKRRSAFESARSARGAARKNPFG